MPQSDVKLDGNEVVVEGDRLAVEADRTDVVNLVAGGATIEGEARVEGHLHARSMETADKLAARWLDLADRLAIGQGVATLYQPKLRRADRPRERTYEEVPDEVVFENVTTVGPGILIAGTDEEVDDLRVDPSREFDPDLWSRTEVEIDPTALEVGLLDIPAPCDVGPEEYPHSSGDGSRNPGLDVEEALRAGQEALLDDLLEFVDSLTVDDESAFVDALSARLMEWSKIVPLLAPPDHTRWDPPDDHEEIYESPGMSTEHATELSRCLFRALSEAPDMSDSDRRVLFHGIVLGLSHNLQLNTAGYRAVSVNSDVVIRGNVYVTGKVVSTDHVRTPFAHWLDLAARLSGWQIDNALSRLARLDEELRDFLEDEAERVRTSGAIDPHERDPDFPREPSGILDRLDFHDLFTDPSPVDDGETWRVDRLLDGRGLGRWALESMTKVAATAGEAIETGLAGHGDRRSIAERGMQRIVGKFLDLTPTPSRSEESITQLVEEMAEAWNERLLEEGVAEDVAHRVVSALTGRRTGGEATLTRAELHGVAVAMRASGAGLRIDRRVDARTLLDSIKRALLRGPQGDR